MLLCFLFLCPAAVAAAITAAAGGAASFAAAAGATMLAGGGGGAVSDGGGEVYGGGSQATTREKNRQAQQRFRQRQKDRIVELEAENGALQEQVRLALWCLQQQQQQQEGRWEGAYAVAICKLCAGSADCQVQLQASMHGFNCVPFLLDACSIKYTLC
jgi:hypothetical protein